MTAADCFGQRYAEQHEAACGQHVTHESLPGDPAVAVACAGKTDDRRALLIGS